MSRILENSEEFGRFLKNSYCTWPVIFRSNNMKSIIQEHLRVSASFGLLFSMFERLNFNLKVLFETGSFMRVSTVEHKECFESIH